MDNRQNSTNINYFPGHMAKAKRQIKEKLALVDVVVHVIDARIPMSSFNKDILSFIQNKEKIIFMSKYDLCDKEVTNNWRDYYISKGFKVVLGVNNFKTDFINAVLECMDQVNLKRKNKGLLPKKAKVMIVGVSNVGKSTLINKLVNKNVAVVGNKPGVTKSVSIVKINDKIDLIDTPGVLWPKIDSLEVGLNLASMTIIKEEVLPIDDVAIHILEKLNLYYKDILEQVFGLTEFNKEDLVGCYEIIAKFKHFPNLDGEVDYDRVSLYVLNSIKNETIKGITFDRM